MNVNNVNLKSVNTGYFPNPNVLKNDSAKLEPIRFDLTLVSLDKV